MPKPKPSKLSIVRKLVRRAFAAGLRAEPRKPEPKRG
jgi:hypothetical protein